MQSRLVAAAAIFVGCLGFSGCSVWSYAWRVNVTERKLFCEEEDDEVSLATYRSWADQAWAETGACCPNDCTQADYAWGFREGFAQFVYAGGNGQPPAMPPKPYWQANMRSREGAAAAASWFEGYRHGARVAREGGYRDATTIKLSGSLKDCDACGCPDNHTSGCPIQSTPVEASGPAFETPGVIPPPSEVVIPLEAPAAPEPATEDDEAEPLPSLESDATLSTPMFIEPTAARAAESGRVRTALFHIVR